MNGLSIPLALGLLLSSGRADAADQPRAAAPVKAPAPAAKMKAGRGAIPTARPKAAGEVAVDRLLQMTPQQREKALAAFPPERRERIANRLNELQKLPITAQHSLMTRQEILRSLPLQRQNQVRRSLQQFIDLPEERRAAVNRELLRMAPMADEDRRSYMNTEEFRNRYTANEQQMMSNLSAITPPPE